MSFIPPRWRKPVWVAGIGTVFAVAWVIHGGRHWWVWVSLIVIAAAGRAFAFYMWAGEDDDIGALAGSRADERQKLLSLRARALTCNITVAAAAIGLAAAIALRAGWWWPLAVILAVACLSYLLSLPACGIAGEGPADDAQPDRPAQAPAGG